jgi:deoxyribose-phosphate aldolase
VKEATIETIKPAEIAALSDHTFLKRSESYRLEAAMGESPKKLREKDFWKFLESSCTLPLTPYALCIRPEDVKVARRILDQNGKTNIKIASVVGFPDGGWVDTSFKLFESHHALDHGANEVDVVMNYVALKKGDHSYVLQELRQLVSLVHSKKGILKLILETSELSSHDIIQACRMAEHVGVDFLKTSTGFSANGARTDQLLLIRSHFSSGIKVSGGVTFQNVYPFLVAASGIGQGKIALDPSRVRIGESQLLQQLCGLTQKQNSYATSKKS